MHDGARGRNASEISRSQPSPQRQSRCGIYLSQKMGMKKNRTSEGGQVVGTTEARRKEPLCVSDPK
jgi:hypothetical protein